MASRSRFSLLQPDLVLKSSILGLTPEVLAENNLKGLVLDVDETLIPTRASEVSPELLHWLAQIKSVVSLWLVSNNISKTRISRIAKTLDLPYLLGARKPSRRKLRQAVTAMNLPFDQVAMVGDRLFTDVIAGNRLGMFTILVEPMIDPSLEAQRYPVRAFEVWVSQLLGASLESTD
ncbi:MAG TPA: YqeG family HAD IIIA-type phosphatase [Candidatus Caenarcaniphilales bacterium]